MSVRAPSRTLVLALQSTSRRSPAIARGLHASAHRSSPTSSPSRSASVANPPSTSKVREAASASGTRPLRMVMFGKPGAGKGTLSARLVERYDVETISTGDLLRAEVRAKTALGREAEAVMASGGILEDDVVLALVEKKLLSLRQAGVENWLLDGFPRTLGQGRLLDPLLQKISSPLSLIVNLDVPDEEILSRIADRWTHLPSGRVYNLGYNKPKVKGRDDITGEPLSKRTDDKPEIASRRLQQFYEMTSPLLQYYSAHGFDLSNASASSASAAASGAAAAERDQLLMASIHGRSSDEIWPVLESIVLDDFAVRPRPRRPSQPAAKSAAPPADRSRLPHTAASMSTGK